MRFNIITCPECKFVQDWAGYSKRLCWEKKAESNDEIDGSFMSYCKKASIYPEFSQVVAVSMKVEGWDIVYDARDGEKEMLEKINEVFKKNNRRLGGFNIYGFAIPFLWKRMIINGIEPAKALCISELKPRDMKDYIVDVMQIWKQTSFTCSLDLLSSCLLGENLWIDGYGEYVVSAMAQGNMNWCIHYCYQGMRCAERCFNEIMYHDQRKPIDTSMMEEDTIKELQEIGELDEEKEIEENPSPVNEEKTLEEKKKEAEDIAMDKMEKEAKEVAEEDVELPF